MRIPRSTFLLATSVLSLAALCGCREERAGVAHAATEAPEAPTPPEPTVRVSPVKGVVVPDDALVDQDGKPTRLSELARDRVLVVNFVFTACTTICAPMTRIFSKLQADLGDKLERDVRLVSISLDPAVDTPERLTRFAEPYGRQRGWSFLTGSRERVLRVLDALGGRVAEPALHTPVTLIGSASRGSWVRVDGIAPPSRLGEELQAFLPTTVPSRVDPLSEETWWRSVPVDP
ncbi:SCO family protein [Chondromyces apiculatus]|uniref:Cytochrome oxidase biogenesis protein Sco1/SenC/PrrC, putative copper metallochaperone n=1 Tax=Chondromyces apiculatus DSM 436 TaxID=1192034 RepID=A0A017SUI6_9BACT|nr:SCO family protein [Chondromyces apiculatus]EYF00437.1 Cytochrome oxidase biogenesis protein Sco1/SenC/PrrC, putative copper metallochaperone [Chondromyces apiculatus DSM 436]